MIIKDPETGEEREVFTADDVAMKVEEVNKQKDEEIKKISTEYEAKISTTSSTLDTLNKEKSDLEAKLSGGGQIDNFKVLKEALDKKSEEIASVFV